MKCRACNAEKLTSILNLGEQPWCNDFLKKKNVGKEKYYPLVLVCCNECNMLQLSHTVAKETMFADHTYLSGVTKTLISHFYEVADENIKQFKIKNDDLVVDIGGNDGSQLLQYKKAGIKNLLNIECAKRVSEISRNNGINTITEYFNKNCVEKYIGEKNVKLYNASGVFFHLEELHSVIDGIKFSLRDDGVLIVQFMYAGTMIEKLNFDTIYHEHLLYYTVSSLEKLLNQYDLTIFDAYYSEIHSGSIIAKITHSEGELDKKTERFKELWERDKKYTLQAFEDFAKTIEKKKNVLREFLLSLKDSGKKIYAYGAPAKGNTLLNYFNIDYTLIEKSVEINEMKIGNFLPGSHIPIVREDSEDLPDYYLLLSHNFEEEIIKRNRKLIEEKGVKFIIPFPDIKVIG
jgi:hypothetical protein